MGQPLRCDEHPEAAGLILIQNLAEAQVKVGCAECLPDLVRALAEATGVAGEIWAAAQQTLMDQAADEAAKRERAAARPRRGKATAPKDTGESGESTDPPLPISTESMVALEAEDLLPPGYADEHGR